MGLLSIRTQKQSKYTEAEFNWMDLNKFYGESFAI